ncbi:MAG: conjugal transfer protein TraN [Gammaproteobacteria bacterium]|nr:conjugal transfer protein TraN [Gammaproteobacteria bacterium]
MENKKTMKNAVVFHFLLAVIMVVPGLSRAGDPAAEARAVGQAGRAAAGAIAKDASRVSAVPGYEGTDVPEKDIDADGLEDAGRIRLNKPDDPGGGAGRDVIRGATIRPDVSIPSSDPGVVRSDMIVQTPSATSHGASGLASGSVDECDAGVQDAQRGGSCGRVSWCVGSDCYSQASESNTGFVGASARLNMVLEMGGDHFDRDNLRFFAGQRRACTIKYGGLANCCKNSGLLVGMANCSQSEIELAEERNAGNTHYLGQRCARRIFGFCIRRERVWCVFGSKLGRILHEQARPQLGLDWSSCEGFTVAEVERIDFEAVDLSEFTDNLLDGSMEPSISLPETGGTQTLMRDRIRDFYTEND